MGRVAPFIASLRDKGEDDIDLARPQFVHELRESVELHLGAAVLILAAR
jgi:hypothetical protein